jgi:hypothetical protein
MCECLMRKDIILQFYPNLRPKPMTRPLTRSANILLLSSSWIGFSLDKVGRVGSGSLINLSLEKMCVCNEHGYSVE